MSIYLDVSFRYSSNVEVVSLIFHLVYFTFQNYNNKTLEINIGKEIFIEEIKLSCFLYSVEKHIVD